MSLYRTIREKISYLSWQTIWNYFRLSPSLWQALVPGRRWAYMGHTLRHIVPQDPLATLNYMLPARFYHDLTEKNFPFHSDHPLMLYFLVRHFQPRIMIETGVARGASTAYILLAMQQNNLGHLYSIDLPPAQAAIQKDHYDNCSFYKLEDGQGHWLKNTIVGDMIPEWLKDRWSLILGRAELELPKLISSLDQIDIFYHDSLHTESHMMFEFCTAWPVIKPGGLLLSHDVLWNNAFYHFARQQKIKPIIHRSLGMMTKP